MNSLSFLALIKKALIFSKLIPTNSWSKFWMRIFFEKLLIFRFFQIKSMNAVFKFDSFLFRGKEAPWQLFYPEKKTL